jgi:hypothetical protein
MANPIKLEHLAVCMISHKSQRLEVPKILFQVLFIGLSIGNSCVYTYVHNYNCAWVIYVRAYAYAYVHENLIGHMYMYVVCTCMCFLHRQWK